MPNYKNSKKISPSIGFKIDVEMKKEWLAYAQTVKKPISKVIIEAMNRLLHVPELDVKTLVKQQIDIAMNGVKKELQENAEKELELIQQIAPVENVNRIEERIIEFLEYPNTSKKIATILDISEYEITKLLYQLQDKNKTHYNLDTDKWSRI